MLSTMRKNKTTGSAFKSKTGNIKKSMEEKFLENGEELSEMSSECESTIAEVKDIVQILKSVETKGGWTEGCGMPHDQEVTELLINVPPLLRI